MAISPYRPTTELFRPLFDDFFGSDWGGRLAGVSLLRAPEAEVIETQDDIRVRVDLPGMRPDDVEVSLENNLLTIGGEKKPLQVEGDGRSHRWHLAERRYGRFSRSFVLPSEVEQDRIQASFENGVLTVSIPKSERAKPRRIQVHTGDGQRQIDVGTTAS